MNPIFAKLRQEIWASGREARPDEIPTLDDLRAEQADFWPHAIVGRTRALCLFCAMNCGRADVIWVHDAGVDHASLVDNHKLAMAAMRRLYPPHWNYWVGDYRAFLAESEPCGFDLVIADQPHFLSIEVAIDSLPAIARLAAPRFRFIANYWADAVASLGSDPSDLDALSEALSTRTGLDARFVEMIYRGVSAQADLYWAVIDVVR